jgi:hypothetical protein
MTLSGRPDLSAWDIARRQHDVVSRHQLRELGFTHSAIAHREREGRLWRIYRDVFAVGRAQLTRKGEWMAAVLACGDGAALSHLSAAELWDLWEGVRPRWPHVSVAGRAGRKQRRGIVVHRPASLGPSDLTERDAIVVTTLERTLIDLAARLDRKGLRKILRQTERLHQLDLRRLRSTLDAQPRTAVGVARLRRALDAYVPGTAGTEGEPEAAFLDLCAAHGIPLPMTQVPIGRYRVDFLWPDLALVVEIDDRSSHDGYIAFSEDRVRDRALKAAGLDVLRFTRNEVIRDPEKVARELRTARSVRAARYSSEGEGG